MERGNAHLKWLPISSSQTDCLWFPYKLLLYDSALYEWLEMNIRLKLTKWVPSNFFSPGYHFSQSLTAVIRRCQLFVGIPLTVICYNSNWTLHSVCSLDHNAVLCSLKIILRKERPELTEMGQKSSYGHWQLWLNLLDKFRKCGYIKVQYWDSEYPVQPQDQDLIVI